jgi:hypothetical protein
LVPTSFMFEDSGGAPITWGSACTLGLHALETINKQAASLKRWLIYFLHNRH